MLLKCAQSKNRHLQTSYYIVFVYCVSTPSSASTQEQSIVLLTNHLKLQLTFYVPSFVQKTVVSNYATSSYLKDL